MNQEGRFHQEMLRICEEAKEFGYDPFVLRNMVIRWGGRDAAKRLLRRGTDPTYGLIRLWDADRLDLSVEALTLREPSWSALFTLEELAEARRRLDEWGYDLGESLSEQDQVRGYTLRDREGRIVYVGITNNMRARELEHRLVERKEFEDMKIETRLMSREKAKAWEAHRLESYRELKGRNPRYNRARDG